MATRAQVETILVARCGALLRRVRLDGTTVDGTNASLADPIAAALRKLGIAVADPTDPDTVEVEGADDDDLEELLDRSELRTLETILGNWDKPDQQQDADRQDWGKLLALLRERIKQLRGRISTLYPDEGEEPTAGLVGFDFQATEDTWGI
jgi:hypothetical protein